jgi:hypothetical protein
LEWREKKWAEYTADINNAKAREALQIADVNATYTSQRVQQIIALATYEHLRILFRRRLCWIFIAGSLAAGGITVFSWLSQRKEPERFRLPEHLGISLSERGKQFVRETIGPNCIPANDGLLYVIAIKEEAGRWEVLSIPTETCPTVRFAVTDSIGNVLPARKIQEEKKGIDSSPSLVKPDSTPRADPVLKHDSALSSDLMSKTAPKPKPKQRPKTVPEGQTPR